MNVLTNKKIVIKTSNKVFKPNLTTEMFVSYLSKLKLLISEFIDVSFFKFVVYITANGLVYGLLRENPIGFSD